MSYHIPTSSILHPYLEGRYGCGMCLFNISYLLHIHTIHTFLDLKHQRVRARARATSVFFYISLLNLEKVWMVWMSRMGSMFQASIPFLRYGWGMDV